MSRYPSDRDSKATKTSLSPFGPRFAQATLSDIRLPTVEIAKVSTWLKGKRNFLLFPGNPGLGKTYLLAAIYNYLIYDCSKHFFCRVYRESDLFQKLRKGIETGIEYCEALKGMCDDEYVLLDDMGSCGVNEWRREIMLKFIDYRYESELPTMITTNLTAQEIKDQFGMRCYSRLYAKENTILDVEPKDWRQEE